MIATAVLQRDLPDALLLPADTELANLDEIVSYVSGGGVIVGLGGSNGNVLNALKPLSRYAAARLLDCGFLVSCAPCFIRALDTRVCVSLDCVFSLKEMCVCVSLFTVMRAAVLTRALNLALSRCGTLHARPRLSWGRAISTERCLRAALSSQSCPLLLLHF